jgi:hypothetical protein
LIGDQVGHDYEGSILLAEKHSGAISGGIVLRYPAASIEAVRVTGGTVPVSGYSLEGERLLYRYDSSGTIAWERGQRNVEVDYTTTNVVPTDLELAAREICAFMLKQSAHIAGGARLGLSAQANADTGSADYFVQALSQLPFAARVLDRHRTFA